MAPPLAALRRTLDLVPSPVPEHPGLLLRDPLRYSDAVLIVPPGLVPGLACFDGAHTELDLREALVRASGQLAVGDALRLLTDALAASGFLEDETFVRLRKEREGAFAVAPRREPAHAGQAYPSEAGQLSAELERYLDGTGFPSPSTLVGLAAPHVSPEGGFRSYGAAYRELAGSPPGRTYVVLGTSHYGEPGRFGLTRKAFATPLGESRPDLDVVDTLAARGGEAVLMEDYRHAVEHSIEFQVLFLQHVLGSEFRLVPILCGPLLGERPEEDPRVARFLDALAEVVSREGDRLAFVLGVDMAHVGRRYGDAFDARSLEGPMSEVAQGDRRRIARIERGDAEGFWDEVRGTERDALRWCGASAFYAFLRAAGPVRGETRLYEQWNIDEGSVVSFGALRFTRP